MFIQTSARPSRGVKCDDRTYKIWLNRIVLKTVPRAGITFPGDIVIRRR